MENTLTIALSRQTTLRREMTNIANNLANMNTNAFKAERMMFAEHLHRSKGGERLLGEKTFYVHDIGQYRDHTDGVPQQTSNTYDLMINGPGYFRVMSPDGEMHFTRNGHFNMSADGNLINASGFNVLNEDGEPIELDLTAEHVTITRDGIINTENGEVGRISVVTFDNDQFLDKVQGNMFVSDEPGQPLENLDIRQGFLEGSNVNSILEMTRMIEVSRAYQSAKSLIDKEDERIKKVDDILDIQ